MRTRNDNFVERLCAKKGVVPEQLQEEFLLRRVEVSALCQEKEEALKEIVCLFKDNRTKAIGYKILEHANGLSQICEKSNILHSIILMSVAKDEGLRNYATAIIENSIGIKSIMNHQGSDAFERIVGLYENQASRELSFFMIKNSKDILPLCYADKDFFDGIIKDEKPDQALTNIKLALLDNANFLRGEKTKPIELGDSDDARDVNTHFQDLIKTSLNAKNQEAGRAA
jgi:hypothetical protein